MNKKKISALASILLIVFNTTNSALATTILSSTPLPASSIVVDNEYGPNNDTISIKGLASDEVFNVYSVATGGTPLLTGSVSNVNDDPIKGLNATGGTVYVSVKETGKTESTRTTVIYGSEPVSTSIQTSSITVDNVDGYVLVNGLNSGDTINLYTAAVGGTIVGSGTVASGATSTSVSTNVLSSTGGTVYVSVKNANKLESQRTAVKYASLPISAPLTLNNISVNNYVQASSDCIIVNGLNSKDVVKVYSSTCGGTGLNTKSVYTNGVMEVFTSNLAPAGGNIYVSVIRAGELESQRLSVTYGGDVSAPLISSEINVNNSSSNGSGSVSVTGLSGGDIINVYSSAAGGSTLASGTVSVATGATSVTVNAPLSPTGGTIYASVTKLGKVESTRIPVKYNSQPVSTTLSSSAVTVNNLIGTSNDSIAVNGLSSGDIIRVYSSATSGTLIASKVVATGDTSVTIGTTSLVATGGTIYVTVTETGKNESARAAVNYSAESVPNLTTVANKILSKIIATGMSTVDKELAIHDYIVANTEYDVPAYNSHNIPSSDYTANGILINHIGVCEGYAQAFKLLCNMEGIYCQVVQDVTNLDHAWNIVRLDDGNYYQVDCTWDDPIASNGLSAGNYLEHTHFNLSDKQMFVDHGVDISEWNSYSNPKCITDNSEFYSNTYENAVTDGTVVYANYDDKLYKVDSSANRTVISNDNASFINYYNGYIYYINTSNWSIYRVDTKGQNRTQIVSGEIYGMYFYNGALYYVDAKDFSIHKLLLDGSNTNTNVVSVATTNFFMDNGCIYYMKYATNSSNFILHKMDLTEMTDTSLLTVGSSNIQYISYGNYIYYILGTSLYRMNLDGSNQQLLVNNIYNDTTCGYEVNVCDNYIYYESSTDNDWYKANLDGTSVDKLTL
jgi:hypothetical protein